MKGNRFQVSEWSHFDQNTCSQTRAHSKMSKRSIGPKNRKISICILNSTSRSMHYVHLVRKKKCCFIIFFRVSLTHSQQDRILSDNKQSKSGVTEERMFSQEPPAAVHLILFLLPSGFRFKDQKQSLEVRLTI